MEFGAFSRRRAVRPLIPIVDCGGTKVSVCDAARPSMSEHDATRHQTSRVTDTTSNAFWRDKGLRPLIVFVRTKLLLTIIHHYLFIKIYNSFPYNLAYKYKLEVGYPSWPFFLPLNSA